MTDVDTAGQGLLDRLAELHEPGLFADVPDVTGTDTAETLSLTLDAARRVVRARVLDVGRLRDPHSFRGAVAEAFGDADGHRALAALERHGSREEYVARAEALLADGVSEPREPVEPAGAPPPAVTSDNGYLTVRRNGRGRLTWIEVDPEWLGGAAVEHLERAVEQACRIETEW